MVTKALKLLVVSLVLFLFIGCEGNTGGGSSNLTDSQFVSDGSNTGTLTLTVSSSSLPVSQTTGFTVVVRDSKGNRVSQVQVVCDTEEGLALIEPLSGVEATDNVGTMSGIIGCEAPGSYQIGCRLGIGAAKRKFDAVTCTGDIPVGFDGFDNAGGGTLFGSGGDGTGPDSSSDGSNADQVRITGILFTSPGKSDTNFIDTEFTTTDCNNDGTDDDPEAIGSDVANITVVNNNNQSIRFTSFKYVVDNYDGTGPDSDYTSPTIHFANTFEVAGDGGTITLQGNFTQVNVFGSAGDGVADKAFIGLSTPIGISGFRNVDFILNGITRSGESVTVRASVGVEFGDFNNCSS